MYELPRGYRWRELIVRDDGRRLRVFADGALVYEHSLLEGSNQRARRREITLPVLDHAGLPEFRPPSLAIYDDLIS